MNPPPIVAMCHICGEIVTATRTDTELSVRWYATHCGETWLVKWVRR
jgi:hypothetical protein